MEQIAGGVTAARGFQAASAAAGIKYNNRLDMALLFSQVPAVSAGTFTSNVVKAAPVQWDRKKVTEETYAQAIIVNAGIANACTGALGMEYCQQTAECAAGLLGITPDRKSVV